MASKKTQLYDVIPKYGQVAGNRGLEKFHIRHMVLSPDQWAACSLPISLDWEIIRFRRGESGRVPNSFGGVYTFVVQPSIANHPWCSYLLYVGKAKKRNFRARYGDYLHDLKLGKKSRRRHVADMLTKWDGYLWFCYARIDEEALIDEIEGALLTAYMPPANRDFPGEIGEAIKDLFDIA